MGDPPIIGPNHCSVRRERKDFLPSVFSGHLGPNLREQCPTLYLWLPSTDRTAARTIAGVQANLGERVADERNGLTRQIKEACDIVAVIGSYVSLVPAAGAFKCICPFHNDTRPSMQVDARYQNYKCWSCGKKGDVFTFVQDFEKVSFLEAREILAKRAGISLEEVPVENVRRVKQLDAIKWAEGLYQECLLAEQEGASPELGERARKYLGERKLTGATVRAFGLGFAPPSGDWLVHKAKEAGKDFDILREVGLIGERAHRGGYYNRFQDRVMFPIRDARGKTVGFGGRVLPDSPLAERGPKYYNSTETPLFSKKDLLYGLDLARHAGAKEQYLAVVEGYTDVMMAHQYGVTNVVATMGTALNESHVRQLLRFAPKVVLVFDADEGGEGGVDRALEIFIGCDVDLAIATLPDGLDPCDLLTAQGKEPFQMALRTAVDALEFKLTQALATAGDSLENKKRVVDSVLKLMAYAPELPGNASTVKHELVVTRLAHRLGLRQETVWARFGELKVEKKKEAARRPAGDREENTSQATVRTAPADPLELRLLELLLADEKLVAEAYAEIRPEDITHLGLQKLLAGLYRLLETGESPEIDSLRALLNHPALAAKAMDLQEVGRAVANRVLALRDVFKCFRDRKHELGKRQLQEKLNSPISEEEAYALFRKIQARPAAGPEDQTGRQSS